LYEWELECDFVAAMYNHHIGCLYWQNSKHLGNCRILKMSIKAASIISGFPSWATAVAISCSHP
jgi:hypothetical protein